MSLLSRGWLRLNRRCANEMQNGLISGWCPGNRVVPLNCKNIYPSLFHTIHTAGVKQLWFFRSASKKTFCSSSAQSSNIKGKSKIRLFFAAFGAGAIISLGYLYRKIMLEPLPLARAEEENSLLFSQAPPTDSIAKKVISPSGSADLGLVLYQYEPCPFCKKVRAFLDFKGLSYDVVEVNSMTKKELDWSTYKKVPILVLKSKKGYQQLNDSSYIVSALASLLFDPAQDITDVIKFYPHVEFIGDDGKKHFEILNRYFLMFGNEEVDKSKDAIEEEIRWRKWSDDVLIHTLSPNIYRTWSEALEAFEMFSKNGDWEHVFSSWERLLVIYIGSLVMYVISKRLKKRHHLSDDPRQSLYREVSFFVNAVKNKGTPFLGGSEPNLADLAIYGCVSSIAGTRSFVDVMDNTKLSEWYYAIQSLIENRRGKLVVSRDLS